MITFCESISWTWNVKMSCRKCHPLQNEHWMGFFWWTMKKLCPGQDTVDFFYCPKIVTFCILMIFELSLWNHDQDLIKWWLWTQNKMLTKNSDFWLQNDHFAPVVNCESNRAFDCAIWHCESWNLACRCLRICIGLWDLIEPLKTSNSLKESKP